MSRAIFGDYPEYHLQYDLRGQHWYGAIERSDGVSIGGERHVSATEKEGNAILFVRAKELISADITERRNTSN